MKIHMHVEDVIICGLVNTLPHKFLGFAATIIVTLFFFLLLCKMTPKQYSIFCYRVKIGKINCFENVGFAEVKHRPSLITCSA